MFLKGTKHWSFVEDFKFIEMEPVGCNQSNVKDVESV